MNASRLLLPAVALSLIAAPSLAMAKNANSPTTTSKHHTTHKAHTSKAGTSKSK